MNKKALKISLIVQPFYRLYENSYSLNQVSLGLGYLGGRFKKDTSASVMICNADFNGKKEKYNVAYLT